MTVCEAILELSALPPDMELRMAVYEDGDTTIFLDVEELIIIDVPDSKDRFLGLFPPKEDIDDEEEDNILPYNMCPN